jgi:hypothetical protein
MKFAPVALVLVCACVLPEPEPEVSVGVSYLGCPEWMCQSNSPLIDNFGLHEVSIAYDPNPQGFKLGRAYAPDGTWLSAGISVQGGVLVGKYSNGTELRGSQMQGAKIDIDNVISGGRYTLSVLSEQDSPLWAGGQQLWVATYLLQWAVRGTDRWENVCPKPDKELGMNAYYSVLFEGDRVDAASKTIEKTPDTRWFNIGCAGSTLAKMFLTGHTEASRAHGFDTSWEQRQTMLKMLSGDYCGTGTPFTVAGVPLDWKDDKEWMEYISNSELEARWTPDGAACLNTPRIKASQHPDGLAVFPDVTTEIEAECATKGISLRRCDDPQDAFLGNHLLSANPPP